jgi:hypothetical protein
MAHYAFLDENNVVTEVITGIDENIIQTDTDGTQVGGSAEAWEAFYGNLRGQVCKRTSYNAEINGFRKHYAAIDFTYDEEADVFIPPKPFNSWVLNTDTYLWEAPVAEPSEGFWRWDEDSVSWIEFDPPL